MNMIACTAGTRGITRFVCLKLSNPLIIAGFLMGAVGVANRAHAIGDLQILFHSECSSVSDPGVMGCLQLYESSGSVSYYIRLTNFTSTITSAKVYFHDEEDTSCDVVPADEVADLCAGGCANPLHGTYTITPGQQDDMMASNHIILIKTSGGGNVWMEIDKGPPGFCVLVSQLNRFCTHWDPKPDPPAVGCLTIDAQNHVELDVYIADPLFDGWDEAETGVYVDANHSTCIRGEELVRLCEPELDVCTNPLHDAYDLTSEQREDMRAGRHTIIMDWPGEDREIWIKIYPSVPIPTVSGWGVIVMALLLLTGEKVYFARRRSWSGSRLIAQ